MAPAGTACRGIPRQNCIAVIRMRIGMRYWAAWRAASTNSSSSATPGQPPLDPTAATYRLSYWRQCLEPTSIAPCLLATRTGPHSAGSYHGGQSPNQLIRAAERRGSMRSHRGAIQILSPGAPLAGRHGRRSGISGRLSRRCVFCDASRAETREATSCRPMWRDSKFL